MIDIIHTGAVICLFEHGIFVTADLRRDQKGVFFFSTKFQTVKMSDNDIDWEVVNSLSWFGRDFDHGTMRASEINAISSRAIQNLEISDAERS